MNPALKSFCFQNKLSRQLLSSHGGRARSTHTRCVASVTRLHHQALGTSGPAVPPLFPRASIKTFDRA